MKEAIEVNVIIIDQLQSRRIGGLTVAYTSHEERERAFERIREILYEDTRFDTRNRDITCP